MAELRSSSKRFRKQVQLNTDEEWTSPGPCPVPDCAVRTQFEERITSITQTSSTMSTILADQQRKHDELMAAIHAMRAAAVRSEQKIDSLERRMTRLQQKDDAIIIRHLKDTVRRAGLTRQIENNKPLWQAFAY